MKWFKHYSDASSDEFLSELEDLFGLEGYARWWKLLEAVAAQMDSSGRCSASYSWTKWQIFLRGKRKNLEPFLQFLSDKKKIHFQLQLGSNSVATQLQLSCNQKANQNILEIKIPKLLELRDEYTRKSGHTPDNVAQEAEADKEADKEVRITTQPSNSVSEKKTKSDFQKIYETGIAIFPNLAPANTSSIHQWLKAGCDVEKDILPELRRQQGKQIRGWAYFSPAIADAKKTRTEPLQEGRNNGKSNGSAEKRSPLHDWKDAWQHAIEEDNQRQQNQLGGVQVSGKHTLASPDNSEGFADLP